MEPPGSILQEILNSFPIQKRDQIRITNYENVDKILRQISDGGHKSLQVVTDFDQTLTRYHLNGKLCSSSFGVLDNSPLLPPDYKSRNVELYNKYHPIEISHELTKEEKLPHMLTWYNESNATLLKYSGLTKPLLENITSTTSDTALRDNCRDLLQMLKDDKVPVLVFSAGIGNVLEGILQSQDAIFPNMKIVANWMAFDDNGALTGFKEPLIHTFNKNESVLSEVEKNYFIELSQHRGNVILLGDNLGDIHMADGMQHSCVLKIGFLNMNIEDRLQSFVDNFDIVILDDQSMDFVILLYKTLFWMKFLDDSPVKSKNLIFKKSES